MNHTKLGTILTDALVFVTVSVVLALSANFAFSKLKSKAPVDDPVVAAIYGDKAVDVENAIASEIVMGKATSEADVVKRVDELGRHSLIRAAYSNLRDSTKTAERDPKRAEIASILLKAGADVNHKDHDGWAALMWAAWSNLPTVVDALLSAGADVNQTDELGNTALIIAAGRGNTGIARALLAKGADKHLKNNAGLDAWHSAERGLKQHDREFYKDAQIGYKDCMAVLE